MTIKHLFTTIPLILSAHVASAGTMMVTSLDSNLNVTQLLGRVTSVKINTATTHNLFFVSETNDEIVVNALTVDGKKLQCTFAASTLQRSGLTTGDLAMLARTGSNFHCARAAGKPDWLSSLETPISN